MLKFAIPAAVAAAALALGAAAGAQAAPCACQVQHHHRRHIPAHYYVPSYRSHPVRHVAYAEPLYAEPWGPPPAEPGFYEPAYVEPAPVYRRVYEPIAYPPPPPPAAWGPPGYEAADVAYVGPDPGWRPVGHRRHVGRICRPRRHED